MKQYIRKYVFCTLLLLLGVSQASWGATISTGTVIYVDVTNFQAGEGYYLSVVSSSNQNYSITKDNTSAAGSYVPKNDVWYPLTHVAGNIYYATITTASTIGKISVWNKNESLYDQVWQVHVSAGHVYNGTNNLLVIQSGSTYHNDRQSNCYNATWSTYSSGSTTYIGIHTNIKTSSWDTYQFSVSGNTATYTFTGVSAGGYEFGMRIGDDKNWSANGGNITRQNSTMTVASGGANNKFKADVAGDYTFTYNLTTKLLTVTYPAIVAYTVTFNANGHGTAPSAQTVNSGDKAAKPTDPTASGYTFGGWYTNAECTGTAYDFNTAVTSNLTLYAKWTATVVPNSCYALHAEFLDWSNAMKFTESEDGKTASCTYTVSEAQSSEKNFGLRELKSCDNTNDQAAWWYATNNTVITQTTTIQLYKETTPNCSNPKILLDRVGSYVFTLEYSTMKLTVTYPAAPDPYPVSFGVIGNQGGALTAKSGNRVIDSGDAVMSATFTAVPETGYTVEGWYTDIDGTNRIDAAGTETVYTLSQVTEENSQVYVRFKQLTAVYFKQNGLNWNDVYLYLFSKDVWSKDSRGDAYPGEQKGVQPKDNCIGDVLQMKRVHDDIYGHVLTQQPTYLAFCKDNQGGNNELYQTEAVYLYQFNPDMSLFVHERGMAAYRTNEVNYYNDGIWMKYNSTESGYSLVWRQGNAETRVPFTAATAGGYKFEAVVQATAGQTYTLCVTNGRNEWYSVGDNAVLQGDEEAYRLYKWGDWASSPAYVSFTPSRSGNYTITLSLADGKVLIGFGDEPGDAYRLVYVERNGTTQVVCHPSHSVVPRTRVAVGSLAGDTISMHVRPMCKDAAGVESANPNTCEVWLQKMAIGTTKWTTVETIDVKQHASITGNGVYNFVLRKRDDDNIGVLEVYPYMGVYYIRSDAAKRRGGVGFSNLNYIGNVMNRCYYSEYARNYETFDYYYCEWVTQGTDIRFTLATPYSYCITDTLVRNAYEISNGFVGSDGKLSNDANIRFMWNSYDNSLNRAYLAGAGENVQLLSQSGIYNLDGNRSGKVCLSDRQNWVYRADILADANALVKVLAPYQSHDQYFKGAVGDYSEANVYPLITGKKGTQYKIRVLYDFKTNHLICAWLVGGHEITVDDEIETDLMVIRRNHEEAEQLTFNPNVRSIGQVKNAYCVLTITQEYLDSNVSSKEKTVYWVTFPFDVLLSEVFGGGLEYGNDYMVQYYDGDARAKNGCWIDSPTYWRYFEETKGVVLRKGLGYVVALDWERVRERFFTAGNTDVSLYFPSANKEPMSVSGKVESVGIPKYPCSIERDNRYIYDSHWNLIGAPSFANIDGLGNPMPAEMVGDYKVGFLYEYNAAQSKFTVSEVNPLSFRSMYSYMVQFTGTIDWMLPKASGTVVPKELQARRVAGEEECYTLRLALSSNENRLDQTYVRLQDGEATCEFDMNIDLTKIDNAGASLYTLTDGNAIRVAANVQPVPVAMKQIPVGLSLTHDGEYTFALPDGTEGMSVVLFDTETGIRTNLLLGSYTVTLTKGTYEQRFVLEVNPKQYISTASDNVGTEDNTIRKYLINGNLYIRKANRLYDVQGRQVSAW